MFIPSMIKSINLYTVSLAGGVFTANTPITTVDYTYSVIRFLGQEVAPTDASSSFGWHYFTSGSNVFSQRYGGNGAYTATFEVVEYWPFFMRQPMQPYLISQLGVNTMDQAITAVGSKAEVIVTGTLTSDSASGNAQNWHTRVTKTSATNIRATNQAVLGFYNLYASVQVVDWK